VLNVIFSYNHTLLQPIHNYLFPSFVKSNIDMLYDHVFDKYTHFYNHKYNYSLLSNNIDSLVYFVGEFLFFDDDKFFYFYCRDNLCPI